LVDDAPVVRGVQASGVVGANLGCGHTSLHRVANVGDLACIGSRASELAVLARVLTCSNGEVAIVGGASVTIIALGLVGGVRAVVVRAVAHHVVDGARVAIITVDGSVDAGARDVAHGGCASRTAGDEIVHASAVGCAIVFGAGVLVVAAHRVRIAVGGGDVASGGSTSVHEWAAEQGERAIVVGAMVDASVVGARVAIIADDGERGTTC